MPFSDDENDLQSYDELFPMILPPLSTRSVTNYDSLPNTTIHPSSHTSTSYSHRTLSEDREMLLLSQINMLTASFVHLQSGYQAKTDALKKELAESRGRERQLLLDNQYLKNRLEQQKSELAFQDLRLFSVAETSGLAQFKPEIDPDLDTVPTEGSHLNKRQRF